MSSIEKAAEKLRTIGRSDKTKETPLHGEVGMREYGQGEKRIIAKSERKKSTINVQASGMVNINLPRLLVSGMVAPDSPNNQIAEEYRNIKRPILDNALGQSSKLIDNGNLVMVTSAVEGEGKTFTAVNLALSIAQEVDKTVLLIDADVKKNGVSNLLGLINDYGLTDLLTDGTLQPSDVIHETNIDKLSLILSGHKHDNITELMASEKMKRLVEGLANRYPDRIVIFDSPPLLETSEARMLSTLVGQVLVVVEAEKTSSSLLQEAISLLGKNKTIGLVLNKSRVKSDRSGYGYYGYGATKS